jgi:RNA polymerase sigma factor (sigma-70 family)
MGDPRLQSVVEHIRNLAAPELASDRTNEQLLSDFSARLDDTAFTILVKRHAPMVFHVCRRVLGHTQDAEDAFQVTFLVLARNSSAIRKSAALASWLHGVAYRTAMRAKRDSARRRLHEHRSRPIARTEAASEVALRELQTLLDQEVDRLTEKYKSPFVLCCLQGKSKSEAASELGWKVGTVSSRLAAARKSLQARLSRRGVALSAVLGAAAIATNVSNAAQRRLISETVKAALQYGTGKGALSGVISAEVDALLKAVGRSMSILKHKSTAALLLAVGVAGVGVGTISYQVLAAKGLAPSPEHYALRTEQRTTADPRMASPTKHESPHGPIVLRGMVLGPDAKPLSGAQVGVLAQCPIVENVHEQTGGPWLRQSTTDDKGTFRLTVERPLPECSLLPIVVAAAPKCGLAWKEIGSDLDEVNAILRLPPEHTLRGVVVDPLARPAAGAHVLVRYVSTANSTYYSCSSPGPAWPPPVTTDSQGRFAVQNLGPNLKIGLEIQHAQSAPQFIKVTVSSASSGEELRVSLTPARTLSGQVVYADTKKPVPRARVTISGFGDDPATGLSSDIQADAEGRFAIRTFPLRSYYICAFAPPGEPYLGRSQEFTWPDGFSSDTVDIALPRGALVSGKVIDAKSGAPVAGARVEFQSHHAGNPLWRPYMLTGWYGAARSKADGTFQVGAVPGSGYLLVLGPTAEYLHKPLYQDFRAGKLSDQPHGQQLLPHAYAKLDVKPDAATEDVCVSLRRGVTVECRLIGPNGEPVDKVRAVSGLPTYPRYRLPGIADIYDGRFRLQGCDPAGRYTVFFLDTEHAWAAKGTISGAQANDGPITIRLLPCGSAKARLVDTRGEPVKNFPSGNLAWLNLIFARMNPFPWNSDESIRVQDGVGLSVLDPKRYSDFSSDQDGRCNFQALIPGATYQISSATTPVGSNRVTFEKLFTVESGKTLDLGDLPIKRFRIEP